MKDLIVVFSYSHGNTIRIAKMIQKKTGADLKVIETIQPYSDDYDEVVDLGLKEVKKGYEVPFTFTKVFSNRAILTNNLINILGIGLGTNAETLETGIPQDFIDAVNGSLGVCIMFVKIGDLRS